MHGIRTTGSSELYETVFVCPFCIGIDHTVNVSNASYVPGGFSCSYVCLSTHFKFVARSSGINVSCRFSPEGQSPDTSGQAKWPLKPGVFVHVNKMHSLSQLSPMALTASHFRNSAVSKTSKLLKYKRNKSKVYARLERLKDLIGMKDHDEVPIGITQSPGGGNLYFLFCLHFCLTKCPFCILPVLILLLKCIFSLDEEIQTDGHFVNAIHCFVWILYLHVACFSCYI